MTLYILFIDIHNTDLDIDTYQSSESSYQPISSNSSSSSSDESSVDNTIPVHKILPEVQNNSMYVGTSTDKRKKHFCIYCKNLFINIPRHLETKHSEEIDVRKFAVLPKRKYMKSGVKLVKYTFFSTTEIYFRIFIYVCCTYYCKI